MAGELMVEEYKSLRAELLALSASISRWQLVGFVAGGVAISIYATSWSPAAMGLPLGSAIPPLIIGALFLIAGCIFGVIHDLTSICRIAAYIQAFHEGQDTGAHWETRLENIRDAGVFVPLRHYMTPILSLLWVGLICSLVSALPAVGTGYMLSRAPHVATASLWSLSVPVVWLVFWGAVRRSYRAFGPGGFKQQTLAAFYESLRKSGKQETGRG